MHSFALALALGFEEEAHPAGALAVVRVCSVALREVQKRSVASHVRVIGLCCRDLVECLGFASMRIAEGYVRDEPLVHEPRDEASAQMCKSGLDVEPVARVVEDVHPWPQVIPSLPRRAAEEAGAVICTILPVAEPLAVLTRQHPRIVEPFGLVRAIDERRFPRRKPHEAT
ncbi:MAG: hypothetical protein ACRELB_27345, partial [Polyangiaceae bacterium]